MDRSLALLAALVMAAITLSTACMATPSRPMAFTLQALAGRPEVQLSLRRGDAEHHSSMSNAFAPADLAGLDLAALRQPGQRPIQFAYVREAGRVDCAGNGGNSAASGQCTFTRNAAFAQFLAARGIGEPSLEQAYELTMTGATRDLVETLAQFRYPRPNIDQLTELSAVGVDRPYIASLAGRGYTPQTLDELTAFAALEVTPEYVDALARSGYRHLSGDEITEFKALGIEPAFIASLASAGYRNLSADEVEQMAALDIDPAFISSFARIGYANLPVDTLVQLKALDVTPEFVERLRRSGIVAESADKLVALKAIGEDAARKRR